MKKNILIFCSWLDAEGSVGIFFREQAEILKPEYNPILVTFNEKLYSLKTSFNIRKYYNIFQFNHFYDIIIKKSTEGVKILEIYYPYFIDGNQYINKKSRVKTIYHLQKYLKEKKIDIALIHAQSLFDAGFWAYRYSIKYNVPYLLTEHNQLTFRKISLQKQRLAEEILNNSMSNLVVSADKIRQFATNGFFNDFVNVGNLISEEFYFRSTKKYTNSINIITMGAFHPLKDHKTMFDALIKLDKIVKEQIRFTWIGFNAWGVDNSLEVNNFINQFVFNNITIELIPTLDRDAIASKLNASDLFLFSSISEGMPVSVLEALACGLPVFSSNCGGVDELLNESNGRIYPVKDSQKLFSLLADFIHGKIKFNTPSEISKEILLKFDKAAFKRRIIDIYESCLAVDKI